MKIKIVKQADSSLRYLINKTRLNILIIIQKENVHEFTDQSFFNFPLFLVPAFDSNDFEVKNLPIFDGHFDSVQTVKTDTIESTTSSTRESLSEHTRKIFFNLDYQNVPITENQLGTFGMIWD